MAAPTRDELEARYYALKELLTSGAKTVEYADKKIEARSPDELRKLIADLEEELWPERFCNNNGRVVTVYNSGYRCRPYNHCFRIRRF